MTGANDAPDKSAASPKRGRSRRRGRGQRRLGVALVVLSVVLLTVVGVGAWFYFSFAASVNAANGRIDAGIKRALETPPPTTLVTVPQNSSSTAAAEKAASVSNLLLLGTDARPGVVESPGSSDMIMLLHVDLKLDYLSVLAVPRDLWVNIPGFGMDRINAAYDRGGPALTIATIKSTLGIDVNKYIGVDFTQFPGLIDSLGGVYVDVDRKYTDTPWWKFDLSPGYQLLDGANALLYSRDRFDELGVPGRMERQERILAGVRIQARGWNTLKLPGIVNTIMQSATTNLSAAEMLQLGRWLIGLDGSRIKQINIDAHGETIDGNSVVVADQAALAQAVADYLTPPSQEPVQGTTSGATTAGQAVIGTAAANTASAGEVLVAAEGDAVQSALTTFAATSAGQSPTAAGIIGAAAWKAAQKTVPFPLEAPTYLPVGFAFAGKTPEGAGTYGIRVGNSTKPALRMSYRYENSSLYLGISATTWLDAPLASEGTTVESNGITYTVAGIFGQPDHVWWKKDGVLYWVSNTLMYTLSEQELLKIAETTQPASSAR